MSGQSIQILIIEDDTANQMLVRDVLESNGYSCAAVDSAEEGLRLAEELTPALILLDIKLPGMDGVTAAHHLKHAPATQAIKLIGMSAHAMVNEVALIETADFDYFITKPFSYKSLLKIVQAALSVES
ncbi:MAG: response regulator [Pseudomonas sp.]|uniref:response regulator n=1 Tax=Pseudomonas sp. TaxID=306 RepID=UPI003BB7904B